MEPSGTVARSLRCADLPGSAVILAQANKRFLLFGELHGTAEIPALFADFVCLAAKRGPVVVGLELPAGEQSSLDRFMASDGSAEARAELLAGEHWTSGTDGRASEAMLVLVDRLREYRAAGLPVSIVAFVPRLAGQNRRTSQTPYEKAMAQHWLASLAGKPNARFVALVGNIHNLREPRWGFEPAAMHMPSAEILTVGNAPSGGRAWLCVQESCGPHSAGPTVTPLPRGFSVQPEDSRKSMSYDLWYSAGRPFTASPPAVGRNSDRSR